jgi:hypothetical protein
MKENERNHLYYRLHHNITRTDSTSYRNNLTRYIQKDFGLFDSFLIKQKFISGFDNQVRNTGSITRLNYLQYYE